MITKQIFTPI